MEPEPTSLSGSNAVAAALDLDRRSADRLIAAGLAGERFRTERGVYVRPDPVAELGNRSWVTDHPPALVIRLGAVQPATEGDDRPYLGWHDDLAQHDWPTQLTAIDRWWAVRDPEHGLPVVYSLSTFVVHVAILEDTESGPGGLRILHFADQADEQTREAFEKKRIYTGRGGNTVRVAGNRP